LEGIVSVSSPPNPLSFDDIDKLGEAFNELEALVSLSNNVSGLRSILDTIGDEIDGVVPLLEESLATLARTHPIIYIAVNALLVPYRLMERQREYFDQMRNLASGIRSSLKYWTDALSEMKSESAKAPVTNLLKTIVAASQYANDFINKGRRGRLTNVQFRQKLDDYLILLNEQHEIFKEAARIRILAKGGKFWVQRVSEAYIHCKLDPPTQEAMDDHFLTGTRKSVLSDVDAWLESRDVGTSNLLWISGVRGAGKTALLSAIARDPSRLVGARFFIKRGHEALTDPRAIWPSMAFQLSQKYRDVRVNLLELLKRNDGNPSLQHLRVGDQFLQLICQPLLNVTASTTSSDILLIVIDALDECTTDCLPEFLDTIVEWSKKLPKTCKLIVTSQADSLIEKKLSSFCQTVALDTGNGVSEASNDDIRHFFRTKFRAMDDSGSWPDPKTIDQLTQHAAGVFGWANRVVNFVGYEYGDRIGRLEEVLGNMSEVPDNYHVGQLY